MNSNKIIAALGALAILIALYFGAVYLRDNYAQPINTANTNSANNNTVTSDLNTYSNAKYKFSFNYPKNLELGAEDFTYIPSGTGQPVTLQAQFVHEIDKEYCALSGECRPTTQDFGFGVTAIPQSISTIAKSIEFPLTPSKIGAHTFYTLTQGVEGEGINYYFVALNNTTTLMFDQRFMDENVLIGYQGVEDFITFREQNDLMKSILNTLTFDK